MRKTCVGICVCVRTVYFFITLIKFNTISFLVFLSRKNQLVTTLWQSSARAYTSGALARYHFAILTTKGMEQMRTTADVAISRITIWISAPANRPKFRLRRSSATRRGSVPRDVRRMNRLCIRIRAPHTTTLHMTVASTMPEFTPAYIKLKVLTLVSLLFQSMKHQVSDSWSFTRPNPMLGIAQNTTLEMYMAKRASAASLWLTYSL